MFGARRWTRAPQGAKGAAFAFVSGVLHVLALPPIGLWPLAFVSGVPLLAALRGRSPAKAFLLGALQGTVCMALASPWLPATIASFAQLSSPLSALVSVLPWAYQGARMGVAAALLAQWLRLGGGPIVGWAVAIAGTELAYPMLFPTYAAGQVAAIPALCQLAEAGGPVLVSAGLAIVNAAFASGLRGLRARDREAWRPLVFAALAYASIFAVGCARLNAIDGAVLRAPAARISIVQPNVTAETKGNASTLTRALEETAARSREGVDLVVWPESVFDHVVDETETPAWSAALAREMIPEASTGPALLVGAYLAPTSGPMRPSNALLLLDREGAITGIYRKRKPLLFGEYVPFADVFPALERWLPRAGRLTAGTSFEPLIVAGHRIAPLVCYEDLLPSFVREAVRSEHAELLVDASNDAWFGRSSAWQHHLVLATFRAIEQRRFFVRAGNHAGSAVIDPGGRRVAETRPYELGSFSATVRWLDGETPYARYGDEPLGLLCAVLTFARLARGYWEARTQRALGSPVAADEAARGC